MAWTRLQLYNVALAAIGERRLDSLSENREPRRLLDEVWTRGNGATRYFLECGLWNHAMRTIEIAEDPAVTPSFGLTYAFSKPSDFVRLNQLSADESFGMPLNEYEDEAGYWFANITPLYVRLVSDHADYGADMSLWPESFGIWGGHWLATQIGPTLKNDIDMEKLEARTKKLLVEARSKDAQNEPSRFPPAGTWVSSRGGQRRGDRGSRNTLTG